METYNPIYQRVCQVKNKEINHFVIACLRHAFKWLAIMVVSRRQYRRRYRYRYRALLHTPPGPHKRNSLAVDPINFLSIDSDPDPDFDYPVNYKKRRMAAVVRIRRADQPRADRPLAEVASRR